MLHQFVQTDVVASLPIVDDEGHGVGDLGKVVGRDVGRHAHGDAAGAVDQQVGQHARQNKRFLQTVIEVVAPVDRIHVDVLEQGHGNAGQARFRVAHGRRAVAVDGAEVTLAVDQGIAQREILGHAGHRVIDCAVTMGVIFTQHFTDDTGALLVRRIRLQPHVVHRVENAAMHRLQAVAGIGQRTGHDDAHRVVEVAGPHLIFDGDGQYVAHELVVAV